jgi:large repetitive protein
VRRIAILCGLCLLITSAGASGATLISPSSTDSSANKTPATGREYLRQKPALAHSRSDRGHVRHGTVKRPRSSDGGLVILLGEQALEPTVSDNPVGTVEAFAFRARRSGTAASISVYLAGGNRATALFASLYSSSRGEPRSLLTWGLVRSPKANAWNSVAVRSAGLRSGSTYWLAVRGMGGGIDLRDRNGGLCTGERSSKRQLRSLPRTWPAGSESHGCRISAYVEGQSSDGTTEFGTNAPAGTTGAGGGTATPNPANAAAPTSNTNLIPAPLATAGPTVSGSPIVGQTITTSNGSWMDGPASYAYEWEDCNSSGGSCVSISGATSSIYTLQAGDVGSTIRSVVTATNADGSTPASSAPTSTVSGMAPANANAPAITGQAVEGQQLSTTNGSWTGSPTSYAYQWQDCNSSGGSCVSISGATSSTYTLQASDVGSTIRSVVTATNAGGSTPASAPATSAVASTVGGLSCSLNATTSNFATVIADASPGQVVCLASGDYSGFAGTSKSSPGITITSAPGAVVTFNSGMSLDLSDVQNFTLDGTGGGGTMSVGGLVDMETNSDAFQNEALNLTFQNMSFSAADGNVLLQGEENSNITFNRDTFVDANAKCSGGSATGLSGIFYVQPTSSPTTQTGLTVENSIFVASSDLWNPGRAVQDGAPMAFKNNVITGFTDHTESASCNHIDGLQLYSGSDATTGSVTFTGNLCYDDYGCIMGFDGTSDNTITDNACYDMETACINLYADTGSVVNHNVDESGGADPGDCNTMNESSAPIQSCTDSTLLLNSSKSGDRATTAETYTNNIDLHGPNVQSGSLSSNTNNMWSGASSPNINGTPTYTGGTNPTTWAGFELSSGSTGHDAGTDGLDVGIRASAGGPPTGGGSAPTNTAAPTITGTPTEGQTLTTTNGTWTITGNIPTATTYQWFDCPSSTFSPTSCTPIQPQTAPTSANEPTYTLQASDAGDYIISEVTTTNANGQTNATSHAIGPIAG